VNNCANSFFPFAIEFRRNFGHLQQAVMEKWLVVEVLAMMINESCGEKDSRRMIKSMSHILTFTQDSMEALQKCYKLC